MTEKELRDALNKCNTLQEAVQVVEDNYDLTRIKLGIATKALLVQGLVTLVKNYNPPVRDIAKR